MKNYNHEVLKVLTELHKSHPSFGVARHISTATADYGDIWGMTDKELSFALGKYQLELESDSSQVADDVYVDQIVKDGNKLFEPEQDDFSDLDMQEEL
jgi:hypothetical protein